MTTGDRRGIGVLVLLAGFAAAGGPALAQDWPQWRGPGRDGVARFSEPATWPERLQRRWQVEVGPGYATPLLVGDRLYMFSRQGNEEVVQALDAETGGVVWRTGYAAPFSVMSAAARHGAGPKSTPVVAGGRVFTFGMTSIVTAFDAETGRRLWQTAPTAAQPLYHTAMSPVVDGDLLVVQVGGPGESALTAFEVSTGEPRWRWDNDSPAYGSPIVADLGGVRQVVTYTHRQLVGLVAATGEQLWSRPFTTPSDTTSQTPLVHRDTLIQAGRANGIAAFRLVSRDGAWTTENVWRTEEVSLHMTNGVVADGVLYGLSHLNSGQYFALDLDTGRVLWTSDPRQAENAAIVRAGTTIFSLQDNAVLVVMRASRERFDPIRRYEVATSATWAQPVISGRRLYVKDVSTLALWTID